MNLNSQTVLGLLFSIVVTTSMVALPVAGAGASTVEEPTSTDPFETPTPDDTTVDPALEKETGPTPVVVRLAGPDRRTLALSSDRVRTMKAHAERTQQPVLDLAEADDGIEVLNQFWLTNAVLVTVDPKSDSFDRLAALDAVERLHANVEIERPEPSESTATPGSNDTETTYGLEQINAPQVWDELGTRGAGAKVAVLDSGIDVAHPDLELYTENESDPTYPGGWAEFTSEGERVEGSEPYDDVGHGTHVSGTVVGGNESGQHIGVAPGADLMVGHVGDFGNQWGALIAGMEWAVEEDAEAISMSLGSNGYDEVLVDPVRNAESAGVVVIASAGNSGEGVSGSPANVYESFAIGASDENADIAEFSSGEEIVTEEAWGEDAPEEWPETYIVPDVAAPGVEVVSSVPGGDYAAYSGTSMSAPHVTGATALMLSAEEDLTPQQVKQTFETTAWKPDDAPAGKDTRYGEGIIDAYAAVTTASLDSGVEGTVTSEGEPVAGALIEHEDGFTATTDANGSFSMVLAPGEHELTVSKFGFGTTTETVTVEENETTSVEIDLDPALDVALVEEQTAAVEGGDTAELTVDVANVEGLTVELAGDYDEANATLSVAGEEAEFGETLTFDRLSGDVQIAVETAENTTGEFTLEHTFSGEGDELNVTTGPTTVFEEYFEVAVVDVARSEPADQTITALEDALSSQYGVEFVPADAATDAVGEYDAFVVQNFGDNETAEEFMTATDALGVGVVLLDQWGPEADAIPQLSGATGWPSDTNEYVGETEPTEYELATAHPIFEDVGEPGDTVPLYDLSPPPITDFEGASGVTVLADVGDQEGIVGHGLAVDETANTVLASSMGRTTFLDNEYFTDEADTILANSVAYVAEAEGIEPEGAMTIEDAEVAAGDTATVTVNTSAEGVAGYQANVTFDPGVVQVESVEGANFPDPVVNVDNEAGYVSISQAQTEAMDQPALAEITVRAVEDPDSHATELTLDPEDSLVNDRNGETILTTYEGGAVSVARCAPGDVNADGQVTSGDATLTQRYVVGDRPEAFHEPCADLTGDDAVTSADVTAILQEIVGET